MEIIGLLIAGFLFWIGLKLNAFIRSSAGYGKKPALLEQDEIPHYELEIEAANIKFSGFSIHSASEGRLFLTQKRLLFTNSQGTQVGLEVPFDRLLGFDIRDSRGLFGTTGKPQLIVKQKSTEGQTIESAFSFATPSGGTIVTDNDRKDMFKEWIKEAQAFIKGGSAASSGSVAPPAQQKPRHELTTDELPKYESDTQQMEGAGITLPKIHPLIKTCPKCGTESKSSFCPKCGALIMS